MMDIIVDPNQLSLEKKKADLDLQSFQCSVEYFFCF